MKFGVFLPNVPPALLKEFARMAEDCGFESIWGSDHVMSPFPPAFPDYPGYHEAWTTISFLAGQTQRVKLSHQVLVPTFRSPGLLANMGATLDQLSEGRVILTTGAGWYQKEFEAYGYPWEKHRERIDRQAEALKIIRALWTQDEVTFEGKYYQLRKARCEPKPVQKPCPPIWIGGDSKRTMNLAAELADGWLMHGHPPNAVAAVISKMKSMLPSGKNDFMYASSVFIAMGENQDQAEEKLKSIIPEYAWDTMMNAPVKSELSNRIAGRPEECVERIKQYKKAGLNHLILIFVDPEDISLFSKSVMPEFME